MTAKTPKPAQTVQPVAQPSQPQSMRVVDAVTEYEYTLLHLSPRTIEFNRPKARLFATWLAEHGVETLDGVTASHTRRFLDEIQTTPSARTGKLLASQTVHGFFEVVRSFLYWCVREGLVEDRFTHRLTPPRVEQTVIQTFAPSEIALLFEAANGDRTPTIQARDKALLAVLLDTGIRASELCRLTLDHVYFTPSDAWLLVTGKGNKQREVSLGREARVLLHRYIAQHRKVPDSEQHVFLSRMGEPLAVYKLDDILYRLRDRAGRERFRGIRVSAHTFRHTFAVRFLEAGGDVYTLSRLLGHNHIVTTQIYLRDFQQRAARRSGISVLDGMRDKHW